MVAVQPRFPAEHALRLFVVDGGVVGWSPPDEKLAPTTHSAVSASVLDLASGTTVDMPVVARRIREEADVVIKVLDANGVAEFAIDLLIAGDRVVVDGVYPLMTTKTFALDVRKLAVSVGRLQDRQFGMVGQAISTIQEEYPEYAPLGAKLVEKVGFELLALLIAKKTYERNGSFDQESVTTLVRECLREMLATASTSLPGMFTEKEKQRLGIDDPNARRRGSAISEWMRDRKAGYPFMMSVFEWIADSKGYAIKAK